MMVRTASTAKDTVKCHSEIAPLHPSSLTTSSLHIVIIVLSLLPPVSICLKNMTYWWEQYPGQNQGLICGCNFLLFLFPSSSSTSAAAVKQTPFAFTITEILAPIISYLSTYKRRCRSSAAPAIASLPFFAVPCAHSFCSTDPVHPASQRASSLKFSATMSILVLINFSCTYTWTIVAAAA